MRVYEQTHSDKRIYRIPVSGETLASATWTTFPSGSYLYGPSYTAQYAQVGVKDLVVGVRYDLICHLVSESGQEWDRRVMIRCVEKIYVE